MIAKRTPTPLHTLVYETDRDVYKLECFENNIDGILDQLNQLPKKFLTIADYDDKKTQLIIAIDNIAWLHHYEKNAAKPVLAAVPGKPFAQRMNNFLCFLRLHNWQYYGGHERHCRNCGKRQMRVPYDINNWFNC